MKKIPTLFIRDPANLARVTSEVNPECQWVIDGEGVATRKYDGTACLLLDAQLYKRRAIKLGGIAPAEFILAGTAEGKVGWVPVGDGPEDAVHREAWSLALDETPGLPDGTYELLGPKVQGNPEQCARHTLMPHGVAQYPLAPRDFDGLRAWLAVRDIEGLVWHHPDGRMAKIKLRDFGLARLKR